MPDWSQVETDLRWCLVDGRAVDGREVLWAALQMKDFARARPNFHNGVVMSIRDDGKLDNFKACQQEDALRLFNLGRAIVGLKPITA
ncbi:MAG: hypothetical protein JWR08_1059 [Enterovirga sp.]|jgi:hypothetical protein|nr:hypothetical protein [Enterovirga sp.]